MPTSWYQAISSIMERVMIEKPSSVLDVGVGFGKYGVLLRETLDIPYERYGKEQWATKIDGIEIFKDYRNPLHNYIYDVIYYQPADECIDSLGLYDVILMIDVLENMQKDQGIKLLEKLLLHTKKALLISTPINPGQQDGYMGNMHEATRSRWTPIDFACFESEFFMHPILDNKALVVKLYPTETVRENNAAQRVADDELIQLVGIPHDSDKKLHIAYAMPHRVLTGGLKMLVEQIRWLKSRGHTVDVYLRGEGGSALPEWMPVEVDNDIVIQGGDLFHRHIIPCDVIIAGWYDQIRDLIMTDIPVMYWEQGSEPLFGEYHGIIATAAQRESQRLLFSLPAALASVSDFVADMMKKRYNRNSIVIPNGVDTDFFHPIAKTTDDPIILLVGNPYLAFKRFSLAISVLRRLWDKGEKFRVRWICQYAPDVNGSPFPIEIISNPPQDTLALLYASADILLFASQFEGFGMPPLEAMAAGVVVLCTDCGGPGTFLKDGYNSLLVQPEDENAMLSALERLIGDKELCEKLSTNARLTALDFSLDKSYTKLEEVLYALKEQNRHEN